MTETIRITSTDLLTNIASGIKVVDAVAGKVIWPIFAKAKYDGVGVAYNFGTDEMFLRYSSPATAIMTWTNDFLETAAARIDVKQNAGSFEDAAENKDLMVYADGNAVSGSGGYIDLTVYYVEV
jgi:hypothetical protein